MRVDREQTISGVKPAALKRLFQREAFSTVDAALEFGLSEPALSMAMRDLESGGWIEWSGRDRHIDCWRTADKGLRLSDNALGGARIVAIPSNAQLGLDESRPAYNTSPFPKWSLCVTHSALYRRSPEDRHACPLCPPLADKYAAARRAAAEKSRFVQVCTAGHMQDVDWPGIRPGGASTSMSCPITMAGPRLWSQTTVPASKTTRRSWWRPSSHDARVAAVSGSTSPIW